MPSRIPAGPLIPPTEEPVPFDQVDFQFEEAIPDSARLQKVSARINEAPGDEFYSPVELRYKSDIYDKAGFFSCEAVASGQGTPPEEGNVITVYINDTVVFTGAVNNAYQLDNGLVYIEGYDGVRRMQRRKFNKNYNRGHVETIAKDIFNRAEVKHNDDTIFFHEPFEVPTSSEEAKEEGHRVGHDFSGTCADAISKLSQLSDAAWFFDEQDRAHFTNDLDPTIHKDIEMLEHNAGKQSVPYGSIESTDGVGVSRQND